MQIAIIGYGAFGAFLHTLLSRFAPEAEVVVHSSRQIPGVTLVSLEEAAKADAILLAVPIAAYEETIKRIVPHMGERSVLVDVATVKTHTVSLLKTLAPGRRFIATHPMFGPESYEKRGHEVKGLRIVVCEHSLAPEEYAAIRARLASCGFDVVDMSAETHDTHLAETLFLTHYLGQIVARSGFARTEIDTVSFGYLMDAVESVKHDASLFKDVFRFNPYCAAVLDRFEQAETEVRKMLEA